MRCQITAPATNDRGPRYMERALAAIHQANRDGAPIALEYGTRAGRVGQFVQTPGSVRELVTGPMSANYPNCSIVLAETEDGSSENLSIWCADLLLTPELFPILRHSQFEDLLNGVFADPITNILRAIRPDSELDCRVEITIIPASHRRSWLAFRAVQRLDREFFRHHHDLAHFYAANCGQPWRWIPAAILGLIALGTPAVHRTALDTSASRAHEREEDLQAASEKVGSHRFETRIQLFVAAPETCEREAVDRIHQMAGAFGAFTKSRLATFHLGPIQRGIPKRFRRGFLLSHEEVATLLHPPTSSVDAEGMQWSEFTELEPPAVFRNGADEGSAPLGVVRFREDRRQVAIVRDDRRRHFYIVGSTGAGKSTLLLNQIHADMQARRGLTVFDVHGDLSDAVLRLVPTHRANDVIVFDAASEGVVLFNPLACPDQPCSRQQTDDRSDDVPDEFQRWLIPHQAFARDDDRDDHCGTLRKLHDETTHPLNGCQ